MNATNNTGNFIPLDNCYISAKISGIEKMINMYILPDISDAKQSTYSDETGMGRSAPIKVFSHGDSRSISWTAHFFSPTQFQMQQNIDYLRILESLVYPDVSDTTIVSPPPIARIKCGSLLGEDPLCVVLKSYTVKFPTDVAWDSTTYMPIKFDVDMTFEVVYQTIKLPGARQIINFGG